MPTTRIVVRGNGKIYIEGLGYAGNACLEDLKKVLALLKSQGIEVEEAQIKTKTTTTTRTTEKEAPTI